MKSLKVSATLTDIGCISISSVMPCSTSLPLKKIRRLSLVTWNIYASNILMLNVYINDRKSLKPGLTSMTCPTMGDPLGTCWCCRCAPAQGQNNDANEQSSPERHEDVFSALTSNLKSLTGSSW